MCTGALNSPQKIFEPFADFIKVLLMLRISLGCYRQFHTSYQNSEINWPKVPTSDFQIQFSMSKIIQNFLKKFSLKNIILGAHFLLLTFKKNSILEHFIY